MLSINFILKRTRRKVLPYPELTFIDRMPIS